MTNYKKHIKEKALQAKARNESGIRTLTDHVLLTEYSSLVRESPHGAVWTDALQRALWEHEIIVIPQSADIYWIDNTVIVPSNRRIEAQGATIRVVPEYPFVLLRNERVQDGTFAPVTAPRDCNISIHGGRWSEGATRRSQRRFHDKTDSFYGVQTCMLLNNINGLTITDVTFEKATSFCVQVGDLTDGVFEHFRFEECFADGLHINGNCENLYIHDFSGYAGDDLVALNMYDWLGSSINYGPATTVFCQDIHSAPDSPAKAMRLQPGIFEFRDGSKVDCSLKDMYFHRLSGISEYKLYYQTPPYRLGKTPEGAGPGSADNLFFEDVEITARRPDYPNDVPVTGHFGTFFINSNIGLLSLENVRYITRPDESKRTHLIAVGPMSWPHPTHEGVEVFDPYVSTTLDTLKLRDVYVNGDRVTDVQRILKVIEFNDVNHDGFSSGKGKLCHLFLDGKECKIKNP